MLAKRFRALYIMDPDRFCFLSRQGFRNGEISVIFMDIKRDVVPRSDYLPYSFYGTGEWQGSDNFKSLSCERILAMGESLFVPGYGIKGWVNDLLGLPPASSSNDQPVYDPRGKNHLELLPDLLIAAGSNRYVYAYPEDPSRCIKIDKPWEEGLFNSRKWRRKRALGSWYADFSANREELRFYCKQINRIGERFYYHAPRFFGIVFTDLGPGMVFERFCFPGCESSQGLFRFLKENPSRKDLAVSLLDELYKDLKDAGLRFFDWHSANFVVHKAPDGKLRIVIVDWKSGGRCNSDNPINQYVPFLAQVRFKKLYKKLRRKIIEGSLKISSFANLPRYAGFPEDINEIEGL